MCVCFLSPTRTPVSRQCRKQQQRPEAGVQEARAVRQLPRPGLAGKGGRPHGPRWLERRRGCPCAVPHSSGPASCVCSESRFSPESRVLSRSRRQVEGRLMACKSRNLGGIQERTRSPHTLDSEPHLLWELELHPAAGCSSLMGQSPSPAGSPHPPLPCPSLPFHDSDSPRQGWIGPARVGCLVRHLSPVWG